jgi:hypothetical protein
MAKNISNHAIIAVSNPYRAAYGRHNNMTPPLNSSPNLAMLARLFAKYPGIML